MRPMTIRTYTNLIIISLSVLIMDQFTKALVLNYIPLHHSIEVIPNLFNLTHIHNPGGAFGFLADQGPKIRGLVFIVISFVAAGLVVYFYTQTPASQPVMRSGFSLIFGGAIGNLVDRIRFGTVVDFLDFYIGDLHWPAFNVADSAITIGIGIFIYHLLFNRLPD